jgi:hypothetical protein
MLGGLLFADRFMWFTPFWLLAVGVAAGLIMLLLTWAESRSLAGVPELGSRTSPARLALAVIDLRRLDHTLCRDRLGRRLGLREQRISAFSNRPFLVSTACLGEADNRTDRT